MPTRLALGQWVVGSNGSKAGLAQGYLLFGIFVVVISAARWPSST